MASETDDRFPHRFMTRAWIPLLCFATVFLPGLGFGQGLVWVDSKSAAVSQALAEGKKVLLLAGRHTCGNCNYTQNTLCEMTSPAIRQVIEQGYVPWFCDVDLSTEWYAYASGLGSFTLPLLCCIDPNKPSAYLDRTTGIQNPEVFHARLSSHLPAPDLRIAGCGHAAGRFSISLPALAAGTTNFVERSADLQQWTVVGTVVGTGGGVLWSEAAHSESGPVFYRVRLNP
jgi:hypothetical protein